MTTTQLEQMRTVKIDIKPLERMLASSNPTDVGCSPVDVGLKLAQLDLILEFTQFVNDFDGLATLRDLRYRLRTKAGSYQGDDLSYFKGGYNSIVDVVKTMAKK